MVNNDDDSGYLREINDFVQWCDDNFLQLNVTTNKELCIDFRRKQTPAKPVYIKGEEVMRDDTFKYLGIVINSKFNWNENIESMMMKVNSRMYYLRNFKKFGVSVDLLLMFYNAIISSTFSIGAACWGRNVKKLDKGRVDQVIHRASRIVDRPLDNFQSLYRGKVFHKASQILQDPSPPLHVECIQGSVT